MKYLLIYSALMAAVFLSGCASPDLYYWGAYEGQVYNMYNQPQDATMERQVELMDADLERARSSGKPLHPGFWAHYGFLQFQLGNYAQARQAFENEKRAFPESAVLMNRFIVRLGG